MQVIKSAIRFWFLALTLCFSLVRCKSQGIVFQGVQSCHSMYGQVLNCVNSIKGNILNHYFDIVATKKPSEWFCDSAGVICFKLDPYKDSFIFKYSNVEWTMDPMVNLEAYENNPDCGKYYCGEGVVYEYLNSVRFGFA